MIEAMHFMSVNNIQGRIEMYSCLLMVLFLILLIISGIYTPRIIFSKGYGISMLIFLAIFPFLQLVVTFKRANSSVIFMKEYQIFTWINVLVYATFIKGIDNPVTNLKPYHELVYTGIGSIGFAATFMFLQSRYGLYFMLPNFCIPNYVEMKISVSRIPEDRKTEDCPICYFPITVDPEKAQVELVELHAGVDNEDHQPIQPQIKEVMRTPCNHYFHPICLKQWLRTRHSCPICNAEVILFE